MPLVFARRSGLGFCLRGNFGKRISCRPSETRMSSRREQALKKRTPRLPAKQAVVAPAYAVLLHPPNYASASSDDVLVCTPVWSAIGYRRFPNCSGAVASIHGPPRSSTKPRTLTRRPSSRLGSSPAGRKSCAIPFQYGDSEVLRLPPAEIERRLSPLSRTGKNFAFDNRAKRPLTPVLPRIVRSLLCHTVWVFRSSARRGFCFSRGSSRLATRTGPLRPAAKFTTCAATPATKVPPPANVSLLLRGRTRGIRP